MSYCIRLICAVDAIDRGAKIHGARTERIAGAAGHEARQIRLALNHFRRRAPIGPFLLARDLDETGPLKALAADAYSIAKSAVISLHEIKKTICRSHSPVSCSDSFGGTKPG